MYGSDSNKFYWLGFMYADGNVYKDKSRDSYTLGIDLSQKDMGHLKKIATILGIPVSLRDSVKSCRIRTRKKSIVAPLREMGLLERKSLSNDLTLWNNIPVDHRWAFVRGYFDGDGSISFWAVKKKPNLAIVGSASFIREICEFLRGQDILCSISSKESLWRLSITSTNHIIKFRDLVYSPEGDWLERKREKLESVVAFQKKLIRRSVYFAKHANKWTSRAVYSNGKVKHIGLFETKEAAICAFDSFRRSFLETIN